LSHDLRRQPPTATLRTHPPAPLPGADRTNTASKQWPTNHVKELHALDSLPDTGRGVRQLRSTTNDQHTD
jgi:hypothetical protein